MHPIFHLSDKGRSSSRNEFNTTPGFICRRKPAGIALVEAVVAVALLALIIVASTQAMLQSNQQAAAMRTMTAARGIVQRNIDTALTVAWDSTVKPASTGIPDPKILTVTDPALPNGAPYNDEAPLADPVPPVRISTAKDSVTGAETALLTGTLTRIVTDVPNPDNAKLRQVTFRLAYTFGSRPYLVQMTTVRAIDD